MSADNIIYIKKEGEKWLVWEHSFSDMDPRPPKTALEFSDMDAAIASAGEMENDHFVEYGVASYSKDGKTIREQDAELFDIRDYS